MSYVEVVEEEGLGHPEIPWELIEIYEAIEYRAARQASFRLAQPISSNMFIPRASWGARVPNGKYVPLRSVELAAHYEGKDVGVISHSRCASIVRGIQAYHMNNQGWIDIAYNYLVCQHGYVYEGRGALNRSAANGTTQANATAMAVCYLGGPGDDFTDPGKHGFWIAARMGSLDDNPWYPHQHYFNTACAGRIVNSWIANGHPDPYHQAEEPLRKPIYYPEDKMFNVAAYTGKLDGNGNGYLDEVFAPDASKVVNVCFTVLDPPTEDTVYKFDPPKWGKRQQGPVTRIVFFQGEPNTNFGCEVWIAE